MPPPYRCCCRRWDVSNRHWTLPCLDQVERFKTDARCLHLLTRDLRTTTPPTTARIFLVPHARLVDVTTFGSAGVQPHTPCLGSRFGSHSVLIYGFISSACDAPPSTTLPHPCAHYLPPAFTRYTTTLRSAAFSALYHTVADFTFVATLPLHPPPCYASAAATAAHYHIFPTGSAAGILVRDLLHLFTIACR